MLTELEERGFLRRQARGAQTGLDTCNRQKSGRPPPPVLELGGGDRKLGTRGQASERQGCGLLLCLGRGRAQRG